MLPLTTGDEAAEYLTGVITGALPYDGGRVNAAKALLAHQRPKLTAMAVSSMNGDHFAAALERAIARSQAPLTIEHQPTERPLPEQRPPGIRGGRAHASSAGPRLREVINER